LRKAKFLTEQIRSVWASIWKCHSYYNTWRTSRIKNLRNLSIEWIFGMKLQADSDSHKQAHMVFYSHGSVHHNSVLIKIQPDATVCRYLFTAKSLYMFRVSPHPSSGVLKNVTAASGSGHNIGIIPVYRYYDLYRRLRLQFLVLLMMGAVTPETCRVILH